MEKTKKKDTLLLIDANSLIHRAFHALPPFTTPDNKPSGALYGLTSILIKIFKEKSPTYIAAAFDRPEPTFRKKEYKEYKATRAPIAEDLIAQVKESRTLLDKFGISSFEKAGWEADDIIATLASRFFKKENLQIIILSGDLDMLQAVSGNDVIAEIPKKGISNTVIYNKEAVKERFDVVPSQFADYKGLVGDTSDNIPGVPGIGPKTAAKLLNEYKTLEKMYDDIKEIGMSDEKLKNKLLEHEEQAILSKKLAKLATDVSIDTNLESLEVKTPLENKELKKYLGSLGFGSLISRIENAT